MQFHQIIAAAWLALVCVLSPAHAEKRVALVIGNDRYANLPTHEQLQKAVNDARAVGKALERLGFEVMFGENADRTALVDRLDAFARRLGQGDTAFFFFSGHGVALGGANYILPADVPNVEADQDTRLARFAMSEHDIVSDLQARGVRVAVVVLDACRTNPFARPGARGVGGERGLAPPPQVKGVFSIYAASAGQAARDRLSDDDRNPNSVFSRVLVPALTKPGLDLTALAFDVREEVARVAKTAGYTQEPSYYDGTIGGRVYLAGAPPVGGQVPPSVGEVAPVWEAVKNTTNIAALDDFIRQFGDVPIYGPLARAKRDELAKEQTREPAKPAEGKQTAAAAPPVKLPVPDNNGLSTGFLAPTGKLPVPDSPCTGPVTVSFPSQCHTPLTAAQERGLKPKDAFRECADCPEMVVLPAGSFTMGSPESEKDRESNEGPQHVVKISKPFAVGKLHVTVDQFSAFVRETRYDTGSKCLIYSGKSGETGSWRNPGFPQEGSHPVLCMNWRDAKAYVDWLAKKTGGPYRLLSEAEWEYAARGRTSPGAYPRFWFGDDEKALCRYVNFRGVPCSDSFTSPAGHHEPNAFGLYDMSSNAGEWTADCWHDSYNGAPLDGTAWTAGSCRDGHTLRGASWNLILPGFFRVASRVGRGTRDDVHADYTEGFRVARTLAP